MLPQKKCWASHTKTKRLNIPFRLKFVSEFWDITNYTQSYRALRFFIQK